MGEGKKVFCMMLLFARYTLGASITVKTLLEDKVAQAFNAAHTYMCVYVCVLLDNL